MSRPLGTGCPERDLVVWPDWAKRGPVSMLPTLAAMLLYSGCSVFVQEPVVRLRPIPADLGTWEARGKVAVTIDDRTEAARFVWQRQNLQTDVVTLSGPFALNRTTLERRGSSLFRQLGASRQPTHPIAGTDPISTALTTLLPETIGNWLLGHDSDNGDWQVDVMEWQHSAPWQAPKRVTIRGANVEVRLVISQWSFEPIP